MAPEDTTDPAMINEQNNDKDDLWTAEGHIEQMIYAGTTLDHARDLFGQIPPARRSVRQTSRQRTRVLQCWPQSVEDDHLGRRLCTHKLGRLSRRSVLLLIQTKSVRSS
jgi:hypothetical protein